MLKKFDREQWSRANTRSLSKNEIAGWGLVPDLGIIVIYSRKLLFLGLKFLLTIIFIFPLLGMKNWKSYLLSTQ